VSVGAPKVRPGAPAAGVGAPGHRLIEQLRRLKTCLLRSLAGVAVGMALVGAFVPKVVDELMAPVRAALPAGRQTLIYTSAIEPMLVYIKVAVYGGLFLAAPWVLYQFWRLITPALGKRERRLVWPFVFFGTLLFYAGWAFCYFLVMPQAFPAMLSFASPGTLSPVLSLSQQLTLVMAMLLGFGIVFEVPVVMAFLAIIGLVNWRFLAKYRRHAIVVNVTLAAIITPTGDPLNLALLAVPMLLFYEVGIILARVLGKPRAAGALAKQP
jgi:sec-independent protein translocase protein TatC